MKAKFNDYEMDLTHYITKHKRTENNNSVKLFELFARLEDLEKHRKFVKILQSDFRFRVDEEGIDLMAKTNLKQYTPCIPNEKSKISYVIHIEEIEKIEDTYVEEIDEAMLEEIIEEIIIEELAENPETLEIILASSDEEEEIVMPEGIFVKALKDDEDDEVVEEE